jgi:hypothetical protein
MQLPAPASLLSAEPFPEGHRGCRTPIGWGAMEALAPGHLVSTWPAVLRDIVVGVALAVLHFAVVVLLVPGSG